MEELGGAHTHMAKSGTAHYVASGEQDAFDYVRELLSYLPSNNYADPPRYPVPAPAGGIEDNLTDEEPGQGDRVRVHRRRDRRGTRGRAGSGSARRQRDSPASVHPTGAAAGSARRFLRAQGVEDFVIQQ